MKRVLQLCVLLAVVLGLTVSVSFAQAPTGAISGVVTDETGAVIPNANVLIKNKATDFERRLTSGADGSFSAPSLPAGQYEIRVETKGFRTIVREATVETGATTTADMRMSVGATTEVVNVEAASAQISYESNTIDGVITRQKIQGLPLNGRSFLNLAFLEGIPVVERELRSLNGDHRGWFGEHRHAFRRQRLSWQRLFLLPRSQHGGLSGAGSQSTGS